ncbi:carbon-nitrogen hydrolase family protein [Microbacterium esteraromaticum]|uniref:carbon-nitrogen hydrolase family protein n=1 Tax=Microbacterium esteraromaticum TaxID=57043 RepID=UPI002367F41F|nr:carbon-nitrogen hydrolase family protein [Microbacterium esteraromaticum]WDH79791.1 carbon-nitrogen hydrolase family protein [Microbacterium esteraromaticum]
MSASAPLVAVCQFAPGADPAGNRERVAALIAQAAQRGARVVVLPEYSNYFIPSFDDTLATHAESVDGAFVAALRAAATAHGVVVIAGMIEPAEGRRVHNTVVAVSDAGVLAVYRKQHLYDAFGQRESDWVAPGPVGVSAVFDVDGVRFGLMTCYDLRFPEVARTLADAGTDAMIVPAEWVRGPLKEHHWSTLLTARAIENTAYVVAADHPGGVGVGLSQVIDPQGVVVAGVSSGEGIAVAPVDPELIARTRTTNPALALRRYRVEPVE